MNPKIELLLIDFKKQLHLLDNKINDILPLCEKGILICMEATKALKEIVIKNNFSTEEAEIYFFKVIKPEFNSKLIYYNCIYKFESKRPRGGDKVIKKYIQNELDKIKRYFLNNNDFYKYYRRNNTSLDNKYFIRGNFDIKLDVDSYFFETDHSFSTSHDFKVAKILAHDLVENYLKEQLASFDKKEIITTKNQIPTKVKLTWTDSKSALTEMVYALYYKGSFNNGTADIKDITNYFEIVFNIDLGDVYRSWYAIKGRKTDPTLYLHILITILQRIIDQEENK